MEITADHLALVAEFERAGRRAPGYRDNKKFCSPGAMAILLRSGAEVRNMNTQQCDGTYVTEVLYADHVFITATEDPVPRFYKCVAIN